MEMTRDRLRQLTNSLLGDDVVGCGRGNMTRLTPVVSPRLCAAPLVIY
jgi:hypothetical protein